MEGNGEGNPKFDRYARVDVLRKRNGNDMWLGGFVMEYDQEEEAYMVIDDETGQTSSVPEDQIKARNMDDESFVVAAGHGLLDVVRSWVEESGYNPGEPVHEFSPYRKLRGLTALHTASQTGHLDVVKYLVESAGLNPNTVQGLGPNPLDLALSSGCLSVASYFTHLDTSGKAKLQELDERELRFETAKAFELAVKGTKIKRKHVYIMAVREFRRAGKFLPYSEAVRQQLLMSAFRLRATSNILYISHRWEPSEPENPDSEDHPDPDRRLYKLVTKFLDQQPPNSINYVYLGYSCCPPDAECEEGEEFYWKHLKNTATALFMSTHILVLPPLKDIAAFDSGFDELWDITPYSPSLRPPNLFITDLKAFMGRAWCQAEVIGALVTEAKVFCHFRLGNLLDRFVSVGGSRYHNDSDGLLRAGGEETDALNLFSWQSGFTHAVFNAVSESEGTSFERMLKQFIGNRGKPEDFWRAWRVLRRVWLGPEGISPGPDNPEAFATLAVAVECQNLMEVDQATAAKLFSMQLEQEDIDKHRQDRSLLGKLYDMLGEAHNPKDRILLTCIVLLIVTFSTGKLRHNKKRSAGDKLSGKCKTS